MMIQKTDGVISCEGLIKLHDVYPFDNSIIFEELFQANLDLSKFRKNEVGAIYWDDHEKNIGLTAYIYNEETCLVIKAGENQYFRSNREPVDSRLSGIIYDSDDEDGILLTKTELWEPKLAHKAMKDYFKGKLSDQITWQILTSSQM